MNTEHDKEKKQRDIALIKFLDEKWHPHVQQFSPITTKDAEQLLKEFNEQK